ncbi:MAG: ECF-type sigma factor [Dissulfurispiraceae bacterium]|jgi:DNA-directed RNA polymerase specialized sigma24 family protein
MTENSVTYWIRRLKAGDATAVQQLWDRYFDRLVRLSQKRLKSTPRRAADEEDIALSAFHSFCLRVHQKKFPQLNDRTDLWRLLVIITCRKASKEIEVNRRRKRGAGRVRGESAFLNPESSTNKTGIGVIADREPTPEFAAQMVEEFQQLLDRLKDDSLRKLALLKMEGYSNEEIAQRLQCGLRTVERRLRGIRAIWSKDRDS